MLAPSADMICGHFFLVTLSISGIDVKFSHHAACDYAKCGCFFEVFDVRSSWCLTFSIYNWHTRHSCLGQTFNRIVSVFYCKCCLCCSAG